MESVIQKSPADDANVEDVTDDQGQSSGQEGQSAPELYNDPGDDPECSENLGHVTSDAQAEADAILSRLKCVTVYGVEDRPNWRTTTVLALQHFLTMFSPTLALPLILSEELCIHDDAVSLSRLIGTILFVCGLITLLQVTFGIRLGIVQGGSFTFLIPAFSIFSLRGECPTKEANATEVEIRAEFESRMQEIQGAIMVSSMVQVVIGFSGIMGFVMQFIGPLAIAPTICLIGLTLFKAAAGKVAVHWGMSGLTMFLIILFSQYLERFNIPWPGFEKRRGCHVTRFPIFKLFPIILAIVVVWFLSFILTVTDVFPTDPDDYGYGARTDINPEAIHEAAWFYFPYPGQWGTPTVTAAGVFGMLAAVFSSMVESVGDYYACARMSGAPPPPAHAINRGIGMEGIGCILAGAFGTGAGSTSYSENIGVIGITKVASRVVVQGAACILILVGLFGKFGALFSTIPAPIIGGVLATTFGMVAAVGISNLQFVDMNSPRNLFIVGFSLFIGLSVPEFIEANPDAIQTGSESFDQILTVLLETSMFVGGAVGFILDNTVPGTPEERGLSKWRDLYGMADESVDEDLARASDEVVRLTLRCYDLPFGMDRLRGWTWARFLPFSPTFKGFQVKTSFRNMLPSRCNKMSDTADDPGNVIAMETGGSSKTD